MNELVPELHDLLKLTNLDHDICRWNSTQFEAFKPLFPNTKTWEGVKQHHLNPEIQMGFPTETDTFYLHIADVLAASFSRVATRVPAAAILEEGASNYRVRKIWKPFVETADDPRLQDKREIIELFRFSSRDPSWEEFLKNERYEHILKNRAEDAHKGKNVTSLYTHCKLAGQFYRILKGSPHCSISQRELDNKDEGQVEQLVNITVSQKWQLTVAKCNFHFLQSPFRARDLNIFEALNDLMEEISSYYADSVLIRSSNKMLLILGEEERLLDITEKAHKRGFWVEVIKNRRYLNEIKPDPESMAKGSLRYENLYNLSGEISLPICELCQMAKATRRWPEDYVLQDKELCPQCSAMLKEQPVSAVMHLMCEVDKAKMLDIIEEPTQEDLCEICFALRARETKLPRLQKWGREEKTQVAWLKISLDFTQLIDVLQRLYSKLLSSPEVEIRFSVIAEFQEDYKEFLQRFRYQILNAFGAQDVENILEDFFCIRVDRLAKTLEALRIYHQLLNEFFPAFLSLKISPLKFVMVCAGSKFPFFEVWRTIEKPQEDIFISLVGRGVLRAQISSLSALVAAAAFPYRKSALHKLAKIDEASPMLAELTLQNRQDKDYRTYSGLAKELRPALDFRSILTFAKLIGD